MFFEKDTFSFNLIDVLALDQKNVSAFNSSRNFSALSFRFRSDACVITDTGKHFLRDNCVSYFPARLDYRREAGIDEMIAVHFDTTNYRTRSIEFFEARDPAPLAELFRRILECWNRKALGYQLQCSAIFYEILAECYRQNYRQDATDSKIRLSVEYMHKHYQSCDLTIRKLAELSYMSEVYFRKLFKQEYGISPQKYIIKLRMQHAAGLISTGYYSLKDVADLSGYRDYKYFTVEFKKNMGVSPSEYLYNYSEGPERVSAPGQP